MTEDQHIQKKLRDGDRKVLEQLYLNNREDFVAFAVRYTTNREEILDVYQDAIIELSRKFEQENLQLGRGSVKTYLFGIGKFLLFRRLKNLAVVSDEQHEEEVEWIVVDEDEPSLEKRQMLQGYEQLGDQCKELLRLYYYRNLTVQEIVDRGHYKDANTVKSQKSRCMKKLKELIKRS